MGGNAAREHGQAEAAGCAPDRCLLRMEQLEDRLVLAAFFVTDARDTRLEGTTIVTIPGTLHPRAIKGANATMGGDTIQFALPFVSAAGLAVSQQINLNNGEIAH